MNKKLLLVCVIVLLNIMQMPEGKSNELMLEHFDYSPQPTQYARMDTINSNSTFPLGYGDRYYVGNWSHNWPNMGILYSVFEFNLSWVQSPHIGKVFSINFLRFGCNKNNNNLSVFVYYDLYWNSNNLTYSSHPFGSLNESEKDGQFGWSFNGANYNITNKPIDVSSMLTLVFVAESNLTDLNNQIMNPILRISYSVLLKTKNDSDDKLNNNEIDDEAPIAGLILLGIIVFVVICIVKAIIESDDPILKLLFFWWLLD